MPGSVPEEATTEEGGDAPKEPRGCPGNRQGSRQRPSRVRKSVAAVVAATFGRRAHWLSRNQKRSPEQTRPAPGTHVSRCGLPNKRMVNPARLFYAPTLQAMPVPLAPPEPAPQDPAVKEFLQQLEHGRGVSPNTVRNYRQALLEFKATVPDKTWRELKPADFKSYLYSLARSRARPQHHPAALRRAADFLQNGSARRQSEAEPGLRPARCPSCPSACPSPSASNRSTPCSMPRANSGRRKKNATPPAPARTKRAAQNWQMLRDVAWLELFYSAGSAPLRARQPPARQRRSAPRHVRVLGKGRKERLCPLGDIAMRALEEYLDACPHDSDASSSPPTAGNSTAAPSNSRSSVTSPPRGSTHASRPTSCATRSPPTSSIAARTCAACRNSSATASSPPRKFTRRSLSAGSNASTTRPIPAHESLPQVHAAGPLQRRLHDVLSRHRASTFSTGSGGGESSCPNSASGSGFTRRKSAKNSRPAPTSGFTPSASAK